MFAKRLAIGGLKTLYFALLATITVWAIPLFQPKGKNRTSLGVVIREATKRPMYWSGLWQGWTMFSPDASNVNFSIQIAIEFYDGTFEFPKLPQLHTMSKWQAYRHDRHRKFAENINRDSGRRLWPHIADYYQQMYFASHGPVKQIDLVRWWTLVPPPDESQPPPSFPTSVNFEHSYIFYTAKYPEP
ncbi:MAG TPA: hypothetical protein VM901_07925 [Bdellovibrionota bacterium]|jgi:hypothetical protein|nr:hypothetical protein [Bdellovibrionota bacterium]